MGDTTIEWTDKVWNPTTGCTKVSAGCKNCYAERIFHRPYPGRDFTDVRTHPDRLVQPLRWRKPQRIFVNSMSDLFHEDVPDEFIDEVFAVMALALRHTFQILTKRPERMREYCAVGDRIDLIRSKAISGLRAGWRAETEISSEGSLLVGDEEIYWPLPNVWLGVSVEDQATADERIPLLLQTPAAVRFVSYEPALGPVNFEPFLQYPPLHENYKMTFDHFEWRGIDWLIAGGESGQHARPSHPEWYRLARDQCAAAGVAYFFKQWGEWVSLSEVEGPGAHHYFDDGAGVRRTGKKLAGRTLDGRTHDEFPSSNLTGV